MSANSNLDRLAAQHAQALIGRTKGEKAKDVDNVATKALGVLQENGVYACFLYLKAKEEGIGDTLVEEMLKLLDSLGFDWGLPSSYQAGDVLHHITEHVTVQLEPLLLAKETLEQMLIYARYGAKARG